MSWCVFPVLPSRTFARTVSSGLLVFLFLILPYFFVSVPCARLSGLYRRHLSARKSYRIGSYIESCYDASRQWIMKLLRMQADRSVVRSAAHSTRTRRCVTKTTPIVKSSYDKYRVTWPVTSLDWALKQNVAECRDTWRMNELHTLIVSFQPSFCEKKTIKSNSNTAIVAIVATVVTSSSRWA